MFGLGLLAALSMTSAGAGDAEQGQGPGLHLPRLPWRAELQERLPELQRAEAGRAERGLHRQRAERLRHRRSAAPDHAFASRDPDRPERADIAAFLHGEGGSPARSRRHAAAGDSDLRRLPRRRRREDGRSGLPGAGRPAGRLHRARAAATTRAASARTPSWPASSPAWMRRISTAIAQYFSVSTALCTTDQIETHGKCATDRRVRVRPARQAGPMQNFRAFRIHQEGGKIVSRLETIGLDDLDARRSRRSRSATPPSTTRMRWRPPAPAKSCAAIRWSAASTWRAKWSPAADPSFQPGQKVLVNGCGLSETHDGGYAEYARLKSDWVVPIPQGLDEFQAMAIGTAGYTAALAIHRMEQNGQQPEGGEIVVTGATGGVGSLAIDMLAGRGYNVVAVTGKKSPPIICSELGAARVLLRDDDQHWARGRWKKRRWAGAIDNVGGELLTWLTRTTNFWGNIASIGLAGSARAEDDGDAVHPARRQSARHQFGLHAARRCGLQVWQRLASDLKPRHLRQHRDAHHYSRAAADGVRRLHEGRCHRPHRRAHRGCLSGR